MDTVFGDFEWDEKKRLHTLQKRNIDFRLVANFDFSTANTVEDGRVDYGERRFLSTGYISSRLFVLVWTPRNNRLRVISLRKANEREKEVYSGSAS